MFALDLRVHLIECGMQKLFSVHFLRVSAEPPFRTTSLICIPTSTGAMKRASEAFIRVVNLTGIIAEVGYLA
jgi:hypothetical protein